MKRETFTLSIKSETHKLESVDPFDFNLYLKESAATLFFVKGGTAVVTSGASGQRYHIHSGKGGVLYCSCKWGTYRPRKNHGAICSHTLAVVKRLLRLKGFSVIIPENIDSVDAWFTEMVEANPLAYKLYLWDGVHIYIQDNYQDARSLFCDGRVSS